MKSLLQELQSRISKRRSLISDAESLIQRHYDGKRISGYDMLSPFEVQQAKDTIKISTGCQQLDKKLFANLLNQERNKYDGYFRSKYKPMDKLPTVNEPFTITNSEVTSILTKLYSSLGVTLKSRGNVACK